MDSQIYYIKTFKFSPNLSETKIFNALSSVGYNIKSKQINHYSDIYFDTQSGDLFRKNILLAKRNNNQWLVFRENELIIENLFSQNNSQGNESIFQQLNQITKKRNLIPYLSVKSDEILYLVNRENADIEISFQNIFFSPPFKKRIIKGKIILNLISLLNRDELQYLTSIIRNSFRIQNEDFNILRCGLDKLKLPLPGAPIPEIYRIKSDDNIIESSHKILARQTYKMRANTEGTIRQLDSEYLHDLRVATRRGRFALKILFSLSKDERCKVLRNELGWIAALLGSVRDYDVFIENISGQLKEIEVSKEIIDIILKHYQGERDKCLHKLIPALKTKRYKNILKDLDKFMLQLTNKSDTSIQENTKVKDIFPRVIKKRISKIKRLIKLENELYCPDELHRIRIAFKGLRYACEFFNDLLPEQIQNIIKNFIEFQDCLGAHQDAIVSIKNLHGLAEKYSKLKTRSHNELLCIGRLLQINYQKAEAEKSRFLILSKKLPKIFKQLDEMMIQSSLNNKTCYSEDSSAKL